MSQNDLPSTASASMPANCKEAWLVSSTMPSAESRPMNWKVWSKMAWNFCSLARSASSVSLRSVMSMLVPIMRTGLPSWSLKVFESAWM